MRIQVAPRDTSQIEDWLFTFPAFYAEFAPLPRHRGLAEHLYVLRDRGLLTAACRTVFASPLREIRLTLGDSKPSVALVQPSFGHRRRRRAFSGWMLGIRGKASSLSSLSLDNRIALADWRGALAQTFHGRDPSCAEILMVLDQLLDELTKQPKPVHSRDVEGFLRLSQLEAEVAKLASLLGRSPRTLQRILRTSSGLSPKQVLAVGRFNRTVHALAATQAKLSHIAEDLGFSDQAHMSREFQRHAGLSPKAFQVMWANSKTHDAVRFFQDTARTTRVRVALGAVEGCR